MRLYAASSVITDAERTRNTPTIVTGRGNIADIVSLLSADLCMSIKDLGGCVRMESNRAPRVVEFLPGKWRIEFDTI